MSLQSICSQNIAQQIFAAPPMIQEEPLGISKGVMQKQVSSSFYRESTKYLSDLIPEIMKDIIRTMTTDEYFRLDFVSLYPYIPAPIVRLAVQTAENIVKQYEEQLVKPAFPCLGGNIAMSEDSESDEEDWY